MEGSVEDSDNTKDSRRRYIIILVAGGILMFLCCCLIIAGAAIMLYLNAEPSTTIEQLAEEAVIAQDDGLVDNLPTLLPTAPPLTNTPVPTDTPAPTITLEPTETPRPTDTPTVVPTPVVLSGLGDSIVDVDRSDDPSIARISHSGDGNFSVVNYGPDSEYIDLLVNTIGAYEGIVALDLLEGEHSVRFEVTASGPWTLEILPLIEARGETVPGLIQGIGDDVFFIDEGFPDTAFVDASTASGNIAIWAFTDFRDLIVNEIAPYQGTVLMDPNTVLVVVNTEGPWSMDITSP
jgi:hypothetical protein